MADAPRAQSGGVVVPLAPTQIRVTFGRDADQSGAGWFGPLDPLAPNAPPQVAGRRFDYPSGFNLTQQPRSYEIGFSQLRGFADAYDIARLVIETRKDQMSRLQWDIASRDKTASGDGDVDDRIEAAKAFFRKPDRVNYWHDWLRIVLEDLLVIDAVSIFKRRQGDGALYALQPIDGATIKRVIDDWGNTPEAPDTAYQQVLKGMPAVDYTTQDLVYAPRNIRAHKVYGCSPIEQAIMTIAIGLKREISQLEYYTDGNIPDAIIGVPATWSPDQVRVFQDMWDAIHEGNTAMRRHGRFVPAAGDIAKNIFQPKEVTLFGPAEEWLARVVCFAFGVSPTPFIKGMNRATAESSVEEAIADGLAPIQVWVKGLIDRILEEEFGSHDLEFVWVDDRTQDPETKATILKTQVEAGIMSINEARAQLGLQPKDEPIFDRPMAFTTNGYLAITGEIAKPAGEPGAIAPPHEPSKPPPEPKPAPPEGSASEAQDPGEVDSDDVNPDAEHKLRKVVRVDMAKLDEPTALIRTATASVRKSLQSAFDKCAADVADQVEKKLEKVAAGEFKKQPSEHGLSKSAEDEAGKIADDLDLSSLDSIFGDVKDDLFDVHSDSATKALENVGGRTSDELTDRVNARAVAFADKRAAELVGKRVLDDGSIVDNPSAKWAITDTTRDMLKTTIRNGLSDNIGTPAIIGQIRDGYAFSKDRALMVARTEVSHANNHGALAGYHDAKAQGIHVQKAWSTAQDEDVDEDVCSPNEDAGAIDLDDTFPSGDDAPPGHPNCFSGDTLVSASSRITGASKRWHQGEMVVVRAASGQELTGTVNHPVLSRRGWVALGSLAEGDSLVRCLSSQAVRIADHHEDGPTRIEEVARAALESRRMSSHKVPLTAKHFHGDATDGDVAIIAADRGLRSRDNAALSKHQKHSRLKRALRSLAAKLASFCDFAAVSLAMDGAARCSVGVNDLGGALLGRHLRPLDGLGGASVARGNAATIEPMGERLAADAKLARELLNGRAFEVALDQIVSVRRVDFSGHVYNLQTIAGHYNANGFVVHNCRCAIVPVVGDGDQ